MSHIRISRTILLAALAASLLLLLPAAASARVGVGIGFYGGPYGYWGGPYGYWGPWGYPYYGYPYGYYGGPPVGEVHIKSPDSDAQIYINGSFAGRAHDLKHIYLAAGTYNIEQRIGADRQRQRIYVVANRSVKIEFGKPGTPSPQPLPPPGAPPRPLEESRPDTSAPPPAPEPGNP
jgi:hypothetical protein